MIEVAAHAVLPRVIAHGTVVLGRVWSGIAQVGGLVVERHPELKKGDLHPVWVLPQFAWKEWGKISSVLYSILDDFRLSTASRDATNPA